MRQNRLPKRSVSKHNQSTKKLGRQPGSGVESLEARQLLAAAFIEGGGRLVVRGTPGNDTITIAKDPSNSGEIRVSFNGQTFDFAANRVKQVKVEAGAGNDLVQSDVSEGSIDAPMLFVGDRGNDTLVTATADDALIGGGDADVLLAKAGSNYVNGGSGNDKIFVGFGSDTLVGEGGSDYLSDAGGKRTVVGATRSDIVVTAALPAVIPSATDANPVTPPDSAGPSPVPTPTPTPVPKPDPVPPVVNNPQPASKSPFVIGVWSQPHWSFDKWQARGINTVVGYESLSGTVSVEKFSEEAVKRGLYMIRHPNKDAAKDRDQKNLLAWMLNDEPDYHNTPFQTVVNDYNKLKAVDKDIPVFVNFSGASALWHYGPYGEADYKKYLAGADWVGNDIYPITAHNRPSALDATGKAAALLSKWSGGKRQFAVIEASDQQLPGRQLAYPGVNADQFRAQVFSSVIAGATGIIYFPQKIGGGFLFDAMNPQVEAEMKKVNARLTRIGDALMTQKDPSGVNVDVDGPLQVTWRKHNGKTYAVVLNLSNKAVTAKMDVKGVSGTANVDGEGRTVTIKNGTISDSFKPYEAHVYVVG
jgi:hypothetical protein